MEKYNLEQAQEEAEKIKQKVESGEVGNFNDAEKLVELLPKRQEYFLKRITKANPKILVFDEGGVPNQTETKKGYLINDHLYFEGSIGQTLTNTANSIFYNLKDIGVEPEIYTARGVPEFIDSDINDNKNDSGEWTLVSRRPTSRTFGRTSSHRSLTEDEKQYTKEYLDELIEEGAFSMTGRIVTHPEQRKRALAWIKQLQEVGEEAGEELKKEIEEEKTKE